MTSSNSKASSSSSSSSSSSEMLSQTRAEILLDRLRSKSASQALRPLTDLSRMTRQTLMDRRFGVDSQEKQILQRSLDLLQERIPVRTAAGMAERLETVGRKIGLKFMGAPVHGCYYLSTEMFYVEINIDAGSGSVNEAKIHHIDSSGGSGGGGGSAAAGASSGGGQQSGSSGSYNCPEMMECLSRGDFATFVAHLEGLVAAYDLGPAATAADKSRAWNALRCVESDLEQVFNSYRPWSSNDAQSVLHSTPLGLLHPRCGGLPLKMRYFLAPPDLLVNGGRTALRPSDVTEALLVEKDLGLTATLAMERSDDGAPCLVPTKSLISGLGHNDVPLLQLEMVAGNGSWLEL